MTEFEDFHVTGRSDNELERAAGALRSQLGFALEDVPAGSLILARAKERLGVEIVIRPDEEMGGKEAYATSAPLGYSCASHF